MKKLLITCAALLLFYGCGGKDPGERPEISNLLCIPATPVPVGPGTTLWTCQVDWTDIDSDITNQSISWHNTSGTIVGSATSNPALPGLVTSGTYSFSIASIPTTTATTFTADFYVTDSEGINSNHLSSTLIVQ